MICFWKCSSSAELRRAAVCSHHLAVLPGWFSVSLSHKPTKPVFKTCHTQHGAITCSSVLPVNDKLVFIAPNPPWRHPCKRSLLCTCTRPSPTDYSITLHLLSLPSFPSRHIFSTAVYPAAGALFRKAAVEQVYLLTVPLGVVLLERAQGRSQTLQAPRLYPRQWGGVFRIQLSPSVSVPLLLHTSCSQTSGEAVPADTPLHKQWAPMYFPLI